MLRRGLARYPCVQDDDKEDGSNLMVTNFEHFQLRGLKTLTQGEGRNSHVMVFDHYVILHDNK